MAELGTSTELPIPRQLEAPPRTTGNAQNDFPIIIDWFWRAYQTIAAAVNYINQQVNENPDINVNNLPDPSTSTVAQAQLTANQAYVLAQQAGAKADEIARILSRNKRGTVTVSGTSSNGSVNFGGGANNQPDVNYTVFLQPVSREGAPDTGAYTVIGKNYTTTGFSFTLENSPGEANSVTFDWSLVRAT